MPHSDILLKVPERFDNALKSGDLLFFPSTLTKHIDSDIEVIPEPPFDSPSTYHPSVRDPPLSRPATQIATSDTQFQWHRSWLVEWKRWKSAWPFCPTLQCQSVYRRAEGSRIGRRIRGFGAFIYQPLPCIIVLIDPRIAQQVLRGTATFLAGNERLASCILFCYILTSVLCAEFRSQASPLLPSELVQTYLLLLSARKLGKKHFAFYNCASFPEIYARPSWGIATKVVTTAARANHTNTFSFYP